jgi:hypothetical protein
MDAKIKSSFWSDNRIEDLPSESKFSLLWVLTQSGRDLLGFSQVSARRFTFETGLPDTSPLQAACHALPASFLIIPPASHPQDPSKPLPPNSTFIVFAKNFLRHQFGKGGRLNLKNHVITSVIRTAATLPEPLQQAFVEAYPELRQHILDAFLDHHQNQAPSPSHTSPPQGEREEKNREEQNSSSSSPTTPDLDLPRLAEQIVTAYPRGEKIAAALTLVLRQLQTREIDPHAALAGTQAAAAFIRTIPSGALNKWLPSAETFFRDKRWQDDATTLHRPPDTTGGTNGKPKLTPEQLAAALGQRQPLTPPPT